MASMARLGLLLLLLSTTHDGAYGISISKTQWRGRPAVRITGDITVESYNILVRMLRSVINEFFGTYEIRSNPLLPEQVKDGPPPFWILIELIGRDNQRIELALRGDNLYLCGFRNKEQTWYELQPDSENPRVIDGATVLNFGSSYSDLLGKGGIKKHFKELSLGKSAFLDAIDALYSYPSVRISDEDLKMGIARMVIMICEAARFHPVRNRIWNDWTTETKLTEVMYEYLLTWSKMSKFLLCAENKKAWTHKDAEEIGSMKVADVDLLLRIVDIIIRPKGYGTESIDNFCESRV
ncbi:hypothetical protein ACP4OV_026644 [Aristida adscensionis]